MIGRAPTGVVVAEKPSVPAMPAWCALLLLSAVCFLSLTTGNAITRRPWSDEGWFANAAYELRFNGFMGTTVLETEGTKLTGIHERTYWILPLYPVTEAGWFALFGFSLFSARAYSIFWGLLALLAWFSIARTLTGRVGVAAVTAFLIAIDYQLLANASFARYDMMAASLGFLGIAVYLRWRERRFTEALFAGEFLVAASCFTHFLGVLHFVGLLGLVIALDRKRVHIRHVLLVMLPYAAGLAAWGAYILQSPHDFVDQITQNATTGGRLQNLLAPWNGIRDEVVKRYLAAYGLGPQAALSTVPPALRALKVLPLLAYVTGVAFSAAWAPLRRRPGCRALLALAATYFAIMTVLDGQKLSYYLVHIAPVFAALLAISLSYLKEQRLVPAWAVAGVCLALCALQAGGMAYRMRQNSYAEYADAASFLARSAAPPANIMASAEMGFAIGFDHLRDDIRLGFHSSSKPDFIAIEEVYDVNFAFFRKHQPKLAAFIEHRLTEEYAPVYHNQLYRIYKRKPESGSSK